MSATDRAIELVRAAASAAEDKMGHDIVAVDVSHQLAITDAFLLVSGSNPPQINAIKDAICEALLPLGAKPVRREGEREAQWILLDFNEIVVHILHDEMRQFYALERLWSDCPVIELATS